MSNSVLVGLVGESPVVEDFPLGPQLARRLRAGPWDDRIVQVEAMNWGAVHIVQGLEPQRGQFERAVLVSCVERGMPAGTLRFGIWQHERMDALALQDRIYEAVTGIVSLDNLLVIGEHFNVWPAEVLTIELEAPQTLFGDMAMSIGEMGGEGVPIDWSAAIGFDPLACIDAIESATRRVVAQGARAALPWEPRSLATMMPLEHWNVMTPSLVTH